jgi:NADH-quinone oxidoreductase subunit N
MITPTLATIGTPFIPSWDAPGYALRPFVGELWLIATIVAVLVVPFFTRKANLASGAVALSGVLFALASVFVVGPSDAGEHFRGLLVTDHVAVFWKATLLIFVAGVILLWFGTTAHDMREGDGPEFFTLLLGGTLGMSLMASTSNLLMLFVAVEMASLPSYVLAGFRKTHRVGAEAAMKYVLFGAAASAVMVYGLSLLYGLYGTLQLADVARAMASAEPGSSPLAVVALVGVVTGLGFKIAAVPFHLWCPDVFEGAGVDVSVFLSVASKGAALVLFLRTALTLAGAYDFEPATASTALAVTIGVIAAVTCTVGNTAALVQDNVKRLLAYSSIAHAGYMMCAVSILVRGAHASADFDPVVASTEALLLYLAVYMFMNLGAFSVVGLVYRQTGRETLDAFRGLGFRSPVMAGAMMCAQVSLIGLIPFAGFTAKLNILVALFRAGGGWWALIAVVAINTVLSAFYYFRVVRAMYLEEPAEGEEGRFLGNPVGLGLAVGSSVVLFSMLILFSPMSRLTTHFSQWEGLTPPPPPTPPAANTGAVVSGAR